MSKTFCKNHAPPIFYVSNQVSYIVAGCCNSWECPRCGLIRAKQEYSKIVYGAETLWSMGHPLFFITLTCRGRELSAEDAEEGYYKWTTRLLNACRMDFKRLCRFWAYCQVTERQDRGHPHSHLITTYLPKDATPGKKITNKGKSRDVLISDWFLTRNISAGLGPQYDITVVRSPKGVANYVAKYLFKDAVRTKWPKGWRRIRYSRSWPREEKNMIEDGFALLSKVDWKRVKDRCVTVSVDDLTVYSDAIKNGIARVKYIGI